MPIGANGDEPRICRSLPGSSGARQQFSTSPSDEGGASVLLSLRERERSMRGNSSIVEGYLVED